MLFPRRFQRRSSRQHGDQCRSDATNRRAARLRQKRSGLQFQALEPRHLLAGFGVRFAFSPAGGSGAEVSSLNVGQSYVMRTYVQDQRAISGSTIPSGILQAAFDVPYDPALLQFSGPITLGSEFERVPGRPSNGEILSDRLDNLNGRDIAEPVGDARDDELLFFQINVMALAAGDVSLNAVSALEPNLRAEFYRPFAEVTTFDVGGASIPIVGASVQFSRTSGLTTNEAAGTDTFTAALTTAPEVGTTVSFTLATSDATEGTVSPTSLSFNASDWNVPKTVVVTGVDDFIEDGNVTYLIVTGNVTSTDSRFSGIALPDISVTNNDDTDSAGVSLNPSFGFVTNENGGQQSTNVRLTSQPTAPVTINFLSSDLGEGTVSPLQLVFTAVNWDQPQLLTLTGVADDLLDGPQNYTIHSTISSNDAVYQSLTVPAIPATNQDTDVAAIMVQPSGGLITSELGTSDEFNVRLSAAPLTNVVLNIASSDPSEGSVNVNQLTFTPQNWNDIQTVRVTGVNDDLVDGSVTYQVNVSVDDSSDTAFRSLPVSSVTIQNQDDDIPSLIVSAPNRNFTTESGGTASFTTQLGTQPNGTVTVSVASDDASEARVSPTSITFNASNWNQPQTITVTGENDPVTDGDVAYNVRLTSSSTSDPGYNALPVSTVPLTNRNDDVAAVVLTETDNLQVDEDGGTDTFDVSLQSPPLGNVTIQLASTNTSEVTVSPASLVFTPQNWNLPRTVTVAGVNDNVVDEAQSANITFDLSASVDVAYRSVTVAPVSVTNVGDRARLLVSPIAGLTTNEAGGADVFGVRLSRQPSTNVILQIASSNTNEGVPTQSQLIFTPSNFGQLQQVTVVGVNDLVADGNQLYEVSVTPTAASDAAYRGLPASIVTLTNQDDDVAALLVSQPSTAFTTEAGGFATVSVQLQIPPIGTVTVTAAVSDSTEASVSPTTLTFDANNWNQPQNITITGVDDPVVDGDVTYNVTLTSRSTTDTGYDSLPVVSRTLTNQNDDLAVVLLAQTDGLQVDEDGATDTFTARLQSTPLANVTIQLNSSNTGEVTVSPASLTFTPQNWNQPQTVTVTGVDDGIVVDGNQTALIRFDLSQSTDTAYRNVTVTPISVTNVDNDLPGVLVVAANPLKISETGTSKSFSVALETPPSQNVTIMAFSSDASEGTVAPTSLVFNASNFNVPQFITVTGVDDSLVDGNVTFNVLLTAVSGDAFYDGITIPSVTVENENDDEGGVQVIADNNLSVNETGTTTTFRVVLRTQPNQNVTVPLAASDASELSIDSNQLVFTPANWDTPQLVTVTGLADNTVDADTVSDVLIGPTVSDDAEFDGLVITPVNVTNVNIDSASISVTAADVIEGGSGSDAAIVYTVLLSGNVASELTLDYTTFEPVSNSAATAGVDYTASSGIVTLAGDDGETIQITVPISGDSIVETNETIGLRLSGLRFGAGMGNADDVTLPASDTLARILNDDAATLTISSTAPQVFEGATNESISLTAQVTLSAAVQGGLSIGFATADASATVAGNDYIANTGTLDFDGLLSESKTISVSVTGDETPESDETFSILLSQLAAADAVIRDAITIIDSPLTLTIQNDDAPKLILRNVSTNASESNAGQNRVLRFEVELDADVNDPDGFTVPVSTADGTATVASGDYAAVNSTLSFSGVAGEIKTVEVIVTGDSIVEDDETFTLRLGAIAGLADTAELVIPNPQITATIENDDTAVITLTASQTSVIEGDSGTSTSITFTATLSEAVSSPFTVSYNTTNGTATSEDGDFTVAQGALSFTGAAGQTQTFTVNVLGDNRLELAETFTARLGAMTGLSDSIAAAITLPSEPITVTISADDRATLTLSSTGFANEGASAADAGAIAFTASLSGIVAGGLQLSYSTADGSSTTDGTAVAGQDYVAGSGQFVFAGTDGETQTISITTLGDNIVEANETFRFNLGVVTGLPAALISLIDITTATAIGTIVNDDTTTLSMSGPATINEPGGPGGTATATYTVTLSAPIQGGLSIEYESSDETATAGADYDAVSGVVTFADGSTQAQTFTVNVRGDSILEADETFQLALTQLVNIDIELTEFIAVENDFVTTTITDDDSVTVRFATAASEVAETQGSHTVNVVLSTTGGAVLTEPLAVDVIVRQSSTAGAADFTMTTTRVVFPIGSTNGSTQPISLTIIDDGQLEDTETIILGLQTVQSRPGEIISSASHTVSITDDPSNAILSGFVWADTNANAQRESHELGISGVTMRLTGVDNQGQSVQRQVNTDINGRYEFRDLAGGTYTIEQDQPNQFIDAVTAPGNVTTATAGTSSTGTAGINKITQIVLPASGQGTDFGFTERGYRAAMVPFSALLASGGTTFTAPTTAPPSIHLPTSTSDTSNSTLDDIFANW